VPRARLARANAAGNVRGEMPKESARIFYCPEILFLICDIDNFNPFFQQPPKRARGMETKLKLGVLVSGGGTNLQAIINEIEKGGFPAEVTCVVSNNRNAYALERARKHHIEALCIRKKDYPDLDTYEDAMIRVLTERGCGLIVMAGFLVVPGERFVNAFKNRVINVHAALIPSFCGRGFYGLKVHEAVLAKGCKVTGATVHFVNTEIDGGPIILQKAVEVKDGDTPEILQKRVMEQAEHIILPEAIRLFAEGRLAIKNNIVNVVER